jgi:hypothetical protein
MPRTAEREMLKMPVSPDNIFITDIYDYIPHSVSFSIIPYYFDCTIELSAHAIKQLVRWAIREGYIILDGSFTIKVSSQRRVYNGPNKEKENEEIHSAVISTPTKNDRKTD